MPTIVRALVPRTGKSCHGCEAQRAAALQDAAGASTELQQQLERLQSEAAQASRTVMTDRCESDSIQYRDGDPKRP